jgi:hypothetical protein
MLLGDVATVVALFIGYALTSWATLVSFGLLCEGKTRRAQELHSGSPWRNGAAGLLLLALGGGAGLGLIGHPLPLLKAVGVLVLAWVLFVVTVGAAGLCMVVADRMQRQSRDLAPFTAFSRSAAFLIGASLLPLAGWFLFAPALLAVSAGAGLKALRRPVAARAEAGA